ncbi:MAG: transposase [Ardenticatenales bacterium]|nr:transposase [Ardenticatenales bacterium]
MASSTKTQRIRLEMRPGLLDWYEATTTLYNQVVAFYFDLYQAQPGLLDLNQQEALTQAERLTHRTTANPAPLWPLEEAMGADIPAMLRRAAINAARGAFQSFHSRYQRWQNEKAKFEAKGKRFAHRPPVPPRTFRFNPPFYQGMFKERTATSIRVRLYSGTSWQWVKLHLRGEPLPEGWEAGSPSLVRRRGHLRLHTPLTKQIPTPSKALVQVALNPSLRICAIDLNLGDAQAVCTILQADGTEVATRYIRGGKSLHARRKRLLGKVARKRRQSGRLSEGEADNIKLWQKIRAIDEAEAHRVSRRIVEVAQAHGATILVFEHLGNLKPQKGRYSRRGNEKRAYWLKGTIVQYSRYKAWEQGILTSRVSPHNTSRDCSGCGHSPVARYAADEAPLDYRPGAPLYLCPACLKRGNADHNAALNIGFRFFQRAFRTLSKSLHSKGSGVPTVNLIAWQHFAAWQDRRSGSALPAFSLA